MSGLYSDIVARTTINNQAWHQHQHQHQRFSIPGDVAKETSGINPPKNLLFKMIGRRSKRSAPPVERVIDKGLVSLPVDILYLIVGHLTYLDRFRLKLAGNHSLAAFISSLPLPSFTEYVNQLKSTYSSNTIDRSQHQALHIACEQGHHGLVVKLLAKEPNILNTQGLSLLKMALVASIKGGQESVFRLLLKHLPLGRFAFCHELELRFCCVHRRRALTEKKKVIEHSLKCATWDFSPWAVQLLLKHGVQVTSKDGQQSIFSAAWNGYEDLVAMLVKNVPRKERQNLRTAYMVAVRRGHVGAVKAFLDGGVKIRRKSSWSTEIHSAAENGHEVVLRLLLARKQEGDFYVHAGGKRGEGEGVYSYADRGSRHENTRYYYRQWCCLHFAIYGGHYDMVKYLLDNDITPREPAQYRLTALPLAAQCGATDIVELLLSAGFDASKAHVDGRCPLEIAARYDYTDTMALLIGAGIKPTIYHLLNAAASGSVLAVSLLLDAGADIHASSTSGNTALFTAVLHEHPEVVRFLLESGARSDLRTRSPDTPLLRAIKENQIESFDLLLQYQYHACQEESDLPRYEAAKTTDKTHKIQESALLAAVGYRRSHMIGPLVQHGADIQAADWRGATPFHLAVNTGHIPTLTEVFMAGAQIHARDARGKTALHYAAINHEVDVVSVLLGWGLEVDARDIDGITPLLLVEYENDTKASELLISHGANPLAKDDKGNGVAHYQREGYYIRNCA